MNHRLAAFVALCCVLLASAPPAAAAPDVEGGVIVHVGAGYEHVVTEAAGPDLQGTDLGPVLDETTAVFELQAALGTRGLGLPGLGTFALGELLVDLGGAIERGDAIGFPALTDGHDGRLVLLHLAYAELDGFTARGALSRMHLRGGRQFHWGAVPVTFDGVTFGYADEAARVAVRVGRRASVYALGKIPESLLAGLDAGITLGGRRGLRLDGEYLFHRQSRRLAAFDQLPFSGIPLRRPTPVTEPVPDPISERPPRSTRAAIDAEDTVHLADLRARWSPDRAWSFALTAAFAGEAPAAIELGRLDAAIHYEGDAVAVRVDARQKLGRDLAYDLALGLSPRVAGRASAYETMRLYLPEPEPYTDAQAIVQWAVDDWLYLVPELGGRYTAGERAHLTLHDADRVRWALGLHGQAPLAPDAGLEMRLRYEGTAWWHPDEGVHFADASIGGERRSHDIEGEIRYVQGRRRLGGRLLAGRVLDVGVRASYERWTLGNRYIDDFEEFAYGFGFDARWVVAANVAVRGGYAFARDATELAAWLAPYHALRLGVEGMF